MFFLFGTFWFWACFVAFILLIIAEAKESGFFGILTLIALGVALQFIGGIEIIPLIKNNLTIVLLCAAGYFPIGLSWSMFKWYLFILDERQDIRESKESILKKWQSNFDRESNERPSFKTEVNELLEDKWKNYVSGKIPKASNNKSRIMRWIGFWPTSMIWTILDDFLTRIVRSIYNKFSSTFDKMSQSVFKDV